MDNKIYGKFWSPQHLISYGKPLMISLGIRGIGKSTALGLYSIGEYYDNHRLFIYTRRNEDELQQTEKNYFYSPLKIYNEFYGTNHEWTCSGNVYTDENKNVVGYSIPLSQADKRKSTPYGALGVRTIIYDEFILAKGKETAYLGSKVTPYLEYDLLIRLYQTVDRDINHQYLNETKIFCLGNFANLNNPILLGCGADRYLNINSKVVSPKDKDWVVELTSSVEASSGLENSYGYRLARQETAEGDYKNNGFDGNESIKHLKGVMNPLINVEYNGRRYGIYLFEKEGVAYVSERTSESVRTISLTMSDGRINQVTAEKWNKSPAMSALRSFVERGLCVYQTARARTDILTYLQFTV